MHKTMKADQAGQGTLWRKVENLTVATTGASGAVFLRELLRTL